MRGFFFLCAGIVAQDEAKRRYDTHSTLAEEYKKLRLRKPPCSKNLHFPGSPPSAGVPLDTRVCRHLRLS